MPCYPGSLLNLYKFSRKRRSNSGHNTITCSACDHALNDSNTISGIESAINTLPISDFSDSFDRVLFLGIDRGRGTQSRRKLKPRLLNVDCYDDSCRRELCSGDGCSKSNRSNAEHCY